MPGGPTPIGANLRNNKLDLNDISAIIVQTMVLSSRDLQNIRFAPSQILGFVNARDPYPRVIPIPLQNSINKRRFFVIGID